jgi:hypothetical protein
LTEAKDPVEEWCHQDAKSQGFLKAKKIQRSSSCLGAFVATLMFSTAHLVLFPLSGLVSPDSNAKAPAVERGLFCF